MRRLRWVVVAVLLGATRVHGEVQKVEVRTDWRVEVMSIVFRLAGNPEYGMANSESAYSEAVEEQFGKFRDGPVVVYARELRRRRGVSYDAVMSMAVHLEEGTPPPEGPKLAMGLEPWPVKLDTRWKKEEAEKFVGLLGEFAKKSDFAGFWAKEQERLGKCGERLSAVVNKEPLVPFFDGYFGKRAGAKYVVIVGMLCGGGNYGVSVRWADGREEILPVIGIYSWDKAGLPTVGDEVRPTLVHEFCHSYTNELVEKHWKELEKAGNVLFEKNKTAMERMAYGGGQTVICESLVRACVVRAMAKMKGEGAGRRQAIEEAMNGFVWVWGLADLLKTYEGDRKTYPTFEEFMPKVAGYFEETTTRYEAMVGKYPQVVGMEPANGAKDVDAGSVKELVVRFDRPMKDGSWALVTGNQSPVFGKPRYEEGRKVLRVPMTLEGGKRYRFWLNSGRFVGLVSEEGMPLVGVEVGFGTK